MSTTKINKIYFFAFLLACLVLLRHCINIEVYNLTAPGILFYFEIFLRELTDLAVPAFFILSGFLFYQNYSKDQLLRKWKSRFFSLVIPYLLWNAIGYMYFEILHYLPLVGDNMNRGIDSISFASFIRAVLFSSYNRPTWFIRYLIVYTVLGPLLYCCYRRRYIGILLLVLLSAVSVIFDLGAHGYIRHFCFYSIGAYLGCNYKEAVRVKRNWILSSSAFICITTLIMMFMGCSAYNILYIPVRIIQSFALWFICDMFFNLEPRWWVKLSFFIFVTHEFVLEAIEKIVLIVVGRSEFGAAVDLLFAPILSLIIIILSAFVLRKNAFVWKCLTGNR